MSRGAHAEGSRTIAGVDNSDNYDGAHAEGYSTQAIAFAAHAEGSETKASRASAHAEGAGSQATGFYSHAEGQETTASEEASHAEGRHTTASGFASHAEGSSAYARGSAAHAEGDTTFADGDASHAQGLNTKATGTASHAGGKGTIASGDYQTVVGLYNAQTSDLFVVGAGSSDSVRKNAFSVAYDGANPTMRLGSTSLSESELLTLKNGGGSSGVSSWNDLTDKPFYGISESYPYFNYPASYGTVQIYGGNGGNLELRNPDFSIPYSEIAQMPITVGYFNAGNSATYTTPNTVGGNENCWYILNNSAPIAGCIIAVCVNKTGTYTINGISLTFTKTGLYFGAYGGYWYAESIEAIKPIDEKYLPKQNTLTIGNTTITESQLQQLLALLNIQNAEEVEF